MNPAAMRSLLALLFALPSLFIAAPADNGETKLAALVGKWVRDYDGSVFEFKDTKSGVWNGKQAFTMSYDAGKKRVVIVSDRWVNTLAFTPNPDVVNGSYELKGKTHRYKITRIKVPEP